MPFAKLAAARVAILGFGREGRAALAVLRQRCPRLLITVIEEGKLAPQLDDDDDLLHIVNRQLSVEELLGFDYLIKAPGISCYRPDLVAARAGGLQVTSLTSLWLSEPHTAITIGVTGTKGKSTTATLLRDLLVSTGAHAVLRGNVGRPLFDPQEPESHANFVVIELSSYQVADLEGSLDHAVLTNLEPEHLDWHGSEERYFEDKLKITNLTQSVYANADCRRLRERLKDKKHVRWFGAGHQLRPTAQGVMCGDKLLISDAKMKTVGYHNLVNACASLAVAFDLGVSPELAKSVAENFQPLAHRLESLGEIEGRLIVNDSMASTPLATMAAMRAFDGRPLHVIVGGADRGLDLAEFIEFLVNVDGPCAIHLVGDFGLRLQRSLSATDGSHSVRVQSAASQEAAVDACWAESRPGDVILLSPGAPSFDCFRDFAARGAAFGKSISRHAPNAAS
ncbi:MAG: UDP-N-acetylmuramoylalanine--D-glutamate ligase [Planctomycetota bacterium]|jgi:UDP-N-acetylmuramoylalanine--D-glutamate ligase